MTHESILAAKIVARNNVNRLINEWYEKAAEALKPFVGQTIYKVDGSLFKIVKDALPEFPNDFKTQGHYSPDNYSLKLRLKTHEGCKGRGWTPEHQYETASSADAV